MKSLDRRAMILGVAAAAAAPVTALAASIPPTMPLSESCSVDIHVTFKLTNAKQMHAAVIRMVTEAVNAHGAVDADVIHAAVDRALDVCPPKFEVVEVEPDR